MPSSKRDTIYSDSVLAQIGARIPRKTLVAAARTLVETSAKGGKTAGSEDVPSDIYLAPHVLREAARVGGVLTRSALASAVPQLFLTVRVMAALYA